MDLLGGYPGTPVYPDPGYGPRHGALSTVAKRGIQTRDGTITPRVHATGLDAQMANSKSHRTSSPLRCQRPGNRRSMVLHLEVQREPSRPQVDGVTA